MPEIIYRLFFDKDKKANDRGVYGIVCGISGIVLNILLFGAKLFAGLISASVSIVADAVNNLSDAGSSVVTLLGFKLAGKKADRKTTDEKTILLSMRADARYSSYRLGLSVSPSR